MTHRNARRQTQRGVPEDGIVRVGVIGLGFMGRTHLAAYRDARADGFACQVVAVCDRDGRAPDPKLAGNLRVGVAKGGLYDVKTTQRYDRAADLLADPTIDLVSICTNTESHAELAMAAMRAGKHVLLEKPVDLDVKTVERVAAVQRATKLLCMPAMCIRFWPGWAWLRERIVKNTFGRVKSAKFERLSAPPNWSKKFYRDPRRTGGALVDLHIHDADFVQYCFGIPDRVSSAGSADHVTTAYHFVNGPAHVTAEGGWDQEPGFAFRMRFIVNFDRATADFDILRRDVLLVSRDGAARPIKLDSRMGYDHEIRHIVKAVAMRKRSLPATLAATLDDAVNVMRLLDAERESLAKGASVRVRRSRT